MPMSNISKYSLLVSDIRIQNANVKCQNISKYSLLVSDIRIQNANVKYKFVEIQFVGVRYLDLDPECQCQISGNTVCLLMSDVNGKYSLLVSDIWIQNANVKYQEIQFVGVRYQDPECQCQISANTVCWCQISGSRMPMSNISKYSLLVSGIRI
ncbi:unnamed protein product [Mytilus edulis]|uniref:Uncharacterized protein n=1 Tax=Mytilus edulis TaxID=6550 RepID=A0A8S3UGL1_MYTED|nr:unnamed protein product [Mytilus edulis]